MRNFYKVIAVGLSMLSLQIVEAFDIDTDIKIETGYRRDDTRWNFDFNNSSSSSSGSSSSSEVVLPPVDGSSPSTTDGSLASRNATTDAVKADLGQGLSSRRAHLSFNRQDVWEIGATATMCLDQCGYFRIKGNYGWVTDGRTNQNFINSCDVTPKVAAAVEGVNTTDALGSSDSSSSSSVSSSSGINCEGTETVALVDTFNIRNEIRDSNTWNFSVALGYPFFFNCDQIRLMPLIGYDYDSQQLKTRVCLAVPTTPAAAKDAAGAVQPVTGDVGQSESSSSSSILTRRHNNFKFSWYGPWIGVNVAYVIDPCWRVLAEIQYQFLRTTRNVNVLNDFECFHNKRSHSGNGVKVTAGVDYRFWCNWHTGLAYSYRYNCSGEHHNRLTWRSSEITANVGYLF